MPNLWSNDRYRVSYKFLFEPKDIWIGLYWTTTKRSVRLYFTVIPMRPLRIVIRRTKRKKQQVTFKSHQFDMPQARSTTLVDDIQLQRGVCRLCGQSDNFRPYYATDFECGLLPESYNEYGAFLVCAYHDE